MAGRCAVRAYALFLETFTVDDFCDLKTHEAILAQWHALTRAEQRQYLATIPEAPADVEAFVTGG